LDHSEYVVESNPFNSLQLPRSYFSVAIPFIMQARSAFFSCVDLIAHVELRFNYV